MSVISYSYSYSLIKHESKFHFDYNDSLMFDVGICDDSYIQVFINDRKTIEICFSTKNQYMKITRENERFDARCYDSNDNEHGSTDISNKAKTIFALLDINIVKHISMDGMKLKLIEMFNLAESTVPTFEELNQ
jgi:hypothetical protein